MEIQKCYYQMGKSVKYNLDGRLDMSRPISDDGATLGLVILDAFTLGCEICKNQQCKLYFSIH